MFEHTIGEALRAEEARPPAGAWDFIKSQIPSSYTPPFKFPTLMVAAVAGVMLGGMTLVKTITDETEVARATVVQEQTHTTHEELTTGKLVEAVSSVNLVSTSQETSVSAMPELSSNDSDVNLSETSKAILDDEPSEQASEENSSRTDLPIETLQPLGAKSGISQESIREMNARGEVVSGKSLVAQPTESVESTSFVKQFSVEGVKECFTPCKLKLKAVGTAVDYSWEAGVHGAQEGKQLDLLIEEPQMVVVFANAKYHDGSEEVIAHEVEVIQGSRLFIPNSFTPNGDGVNDSYKVSGNGIVEFSLTIINSKGKVVHQTTDMANAWTLEGVSSEMEGEVYIAVVRARGVDGKTYEDNVRLTINP